MKKGTSLKMTVYKKPTHTGYLQFESNHPTQVKRVSYRVSCIGLICCYNKQNNLAELDLIKTDLLSNAYPEKVIESLTNNKLQLKN